MPDTADHCSIVVSCRVQVPHTVGRSSALDERDESATNLCCRLLETRKYSEYPLKPPLCLWRLSQRSTNLPVLEQTTQRAPGLRSRAVDDQSGPTAALQPLAHGRCVVGTRCRRDDLATPPDRLYGRPGGARRHAGGTRAHGAAQLGGLGEARSVRQLSAGQHRDVGEPELRTAHAATGRQRDLGRRPRDGETDDGAAARFDASARGGAGR